MIINDSSKYKINLGERVNQYTLSDCSCIYITYPLPTRCCVLRKHNASTSINVQI